MQCSCHLLSHYPHYYMFHHNFCDLCKFFSEQYITAFYSIYRWSSKAVSHTKCICLSSLQGLVSRYGPDVMTMVTYNNLKYTLGTKKLKFPNFNILDQLTKWLWGKNHHVFFDNLYTSIPLMIHLKRHGIFAAGTVHANRKNLPPFFWNPPKMQCGVHKTFQDKNNRFLTAMAWKDAGKFPVKFLSTLSQPTVATHCVRRVGSSRQRIPQPLVAHQYNCSYGFINTFDLYHSKYKVGRNSKKAWKYIYIFLPYWCSCCEFIPTVQGEFYPPYFCKRYDQFRFHLEIGHALIGGYSSRKCEYSGSNADTQANNPVNVNTHENVHMNAKCIRRCVFHSKLDSNTKKIYMKQLMDANWVMFTYARLVTNLFIIGNRNTNDSLTFTHLSPWKLEPW